MGFIFLDSFVQFFLCLLHILHFCYGGYWPLHTLFIFIYCTLFSPLTSYSQLGASHIQFSSTSRPASNPMCFASPYTPQSSRSESPHKKDNGIPKSQSAESCSSSCRSASRRKLPATPHGGAKYPSVIRISKSQVIEWICPKVTVTCLSMSKFCILIINGGVLFVS